MSYIWEKRPWSTMANVDMENADYAAIPNWMRFVSICLMRMSSQIELTRKAGAKYTCDADWTRKHE
jgi:hypothetical protein